MIYFNGRFLTQNVTGVQRFASEIAIRLSLMNDAVFLVPDINLVKLNSIAKELKIVEVKGLPGHLWEQITLPKYLKKQGSPLLVNLCNTAPIHYKNQIVTHHDITYIKYPSSYPFLFRAAYKFIAKNIIRNSKSIITVSEFSKEEICNYYNCEKSKVNVIYNAVNQSFKVGGENKSDKYILAVSSQNYHKNFHGLIESFVNTDLDINLKIIGSASKAFSNVNLNINDKRVHFLGRVDDQTLINLYQNAELFVFPSFYEGFGIPPLEAQACGCPVVASDRASMKEVLQSSVIYFNPDQKSEIETSIKKVLSDADLRKELKISGLKNVERFSWDESAQKLQNILQKINLSI